MNKELALQYLQTAKKAHITWVVKAQALVVGLPMQRNQIPLNCISCKFGEWFYCDAQELKDIVGIDYLQNIENEHFNLHQVYKKIFKIYYDEVNASFFSKLFGMRKDISEDEDRMAVAYYAELDEISNRIIALVDKIEKKLTNTKSHSFAA